jgi:hypothetical protein
MLFTVSGGKPPFGLNDDPIGQLIVRGVLVFRCRHFIFDFERLIADREAECAELLRYLLLQAAVISVN